MRSCVASTGGAASCGVEISARHLYALCTRTVDLKQKSIGKSAYLDETRRPSVDRRARTFERNRHPYLKFLFRGDHVLINALVFDQELQIIGAVRFGSFCPLYTNKLIKTPPQGRNTVPTEETQVTTVLKKLSRTRTKRGGTPGTPITHG